mgnify:CR=1 FL=1
MVALLRSALVPTRTAIRTAVVSCGTLRRRCSHEVVASAAANCLVGPAPRERVDFHFDASPRPRCTGESASPSFRGRARRVSRSRVPRRTTPQRICSPTAWCDRGMWPPCVSALSSRATCLDGRAADAPMACATLIVAASRRERHPISGGRRPSSGHPRRSLQDPRSSTRSINQAMLMYRGETFYMMIDSHNRFVTWWDKIVVDMYRTRAVAQGGLVALSRSLAQSKGQEGSQRGPRQPTDDDVPLRREVHRVWECETEWVCGSQNEHASATTLGSGPT